MLLSWLLRLLLVVLLIRVVWRFMAGVLGGARSSRRAPQPTGVTLVRDPVCGTYLEPSRALHARDGSTTHYFCSDSCRQAFQKTA